MIEPDELRAVQPRELRLTEVWLGMEPYTLIRLMPASDGSGEPALFVEVGSGAEDEPLSMPLLALTEHPAKGNPVAEMLQRLWCDNFGGTRPGIEAVTREFNADWLSFVRGEVTE